MMTGTDVEGKPPRLLDQRLFWRRHLIVLLLLLLLLPLLLQTRKGDERKEYQELVLAESGERGLDGADVTMQGRCTAVFVLCDRVAFS